MRYPEHLHFQWIGDELFNLFGRESLHLGINLNLDVGDVGNGIDRQSCGRPNPCDEQGEGAQQDKDPLAQGEFDDFFNHG